MPRETESHELIHLMIGGKHTAGTSPGGKDQDGLGMKSEGFQTQDGHGVMNFRFFVYLVVRVRTQAPSVIS